MGMSKNECKDLVRGLLLLFTLVASGVGLGYWYRGTELSDAHTREVQRMQHDYSLTLEMLMGRLGQAAERVGEVADVAAAAAQTAQEAAGTADRAALKASKPPATPPAPSKADNRAINQAVNAANEQIKGAQ